MELLLLLLLLLITNPKIQGAMKGNIDLEKLSQGLTKLSEDDLIVVVQMVTDNRTNEMNIKNDVDNGEFTMDLYTLPDSLLKSLWDYVKNTLVKLKRSYYDYFLKFVFFFLFFILFLVDIYYLLLSKL